MLEFSIQQGEVIVNNLTVVRDEPGYKLILGDLRTKYAEVSMYGGYEPEPHVTQLDVCLEATEHSFNLNADSDPHLATILTCQLTNPDDSHWQQMAEVGRYSLTWSIWRWYNPEELRDLDLQTWTPPHIPNVIRKRNEEDLPLEVL